MLLHLGRHVHNGERMTSIEFGGHRAKVKVMKGIIDKCGVRGDATLCIVIFLFCSIPKSNFLRVLTSFFFKSKHIVNQFHLIFLLFSETSAFGAI